MNEIELEPGWLQRDIEQAARRTVQELLANDPAVAEAVREMRQQGVSWEDICIRCERAARRIAKAVARPDGWQEGWAEVCNAKGETLYWLALSGTMHKPK
jgi:hypothetical protein